MCGIAGYYAFGKKLPSRETINKLFIGIGSRGKDASGFAWIKEEKLMVCKLPIPVSEMMKTDEWKNFPIPRYAIFHARASTQGKTENNKNNHPIYNKMGLAIIHNGVISNDVYLFRKHGIKERDAEVDSEIVLALMEKGGGWDGGMNLMSELWGSFACASIDARRSGEMLLWRHSSPLSCAYDQKKDILYFASTEDILRYGLRERNKRGFYITPSSVHCWEMPNDYGMLISPKGRTKEYEIEEKKRDSEWWNYGAEYKTSHKGRGGQRCELCGENAGTLYGDSIDGFICQKCKNDKDNVTNVETVLSCLYCGSKVVMNDCYGDGKCSHCGRYALGTDGYMDS